MVCRSRHAILPAYPREGVLDVLIVHPIARSTKLFAHCNRYKNPKRTMLRHRRTIPFYPGHIHVPRSDHLSQME